MSNIEFKGVKLWSHVRPALEQNLGYFFNLPDLPQRPNLIRELRLSKATPKYDRLFIFTRALYF